MSTTNHSKTTTLPEQDKKCLDKIKQIDEMIKQEIRRSELIDSCLTGLKETRRRAS